MKILKNLSLFISLVFTLLTSMAAENPTMELTIESVGVTASKKDDTRGGVGTKVTKIDKSIIRQNVSKSLSELLNENSVINIKSLGQGALSTASFRGTSSNHTKVLWNGISLNSTTLGSFDFSQVPIYFTDNITLFHGSSSQKGGSGALGGTINLTTSDTPTPKPTTSIMTEYGSNNTLSVGATVKATKGNFTSTTRLFGQQSDNDYKYINKVYTSTPFSERRKNADYKDGSFMQEFYYNLGHNDKIGTLVWGQYNNRSLPQSIIAATTATELTTSLNMRAMAYYKGERGRHKFKVTASNLWSNIDYTRTIGTFIDSSSNRANSLVVKGDYGCKISPKVEVGATISFRDDIAYASSYGNDKIERQTSSLMAYTIYAPIKRLHIEGQATLEATKEKVFGLYNISARFMAMPELLTLRASNSYNYRLPTLNDLYWSPGGNPELNPERGFSWDCSAELSHRFEKINFTFETLYYHMKISDWISWVPSGNGYIWTPINFSNVTSQGTEISAKVAGQIAKTNHTLFANYTYAHSVDNSLRNDNSQGKQLPYIPRNKWNVRYEVWWNEMLWANITLCYTGMRYTSADQEYSTDKYFITNGEVGASFDLKKRKKIKTLLKVDNIFNAYYESTQYFPMPLRMFRGQVQFFF